MSHYILKCVCVGLFCSICRSLLRYVLVSFVVCVGLFHHDESLHSHMCVLVSFVVCVCVCVGIFYCTCMCV